MGFELRQKQINCIYNKYNILSMNLIKATRYAVQRITITPAYTFAASDFFKDRDEAAEKVYINRK